LETGQAKREESRELMKQADDSTVIGKSVTIRGEVSGKEDLFLDGVVEGTITLTGGRLTVGPNARVMADIQVKDVVVFGYVQGDIRASGRIELRESAVVAGNILAGRLSVEENARLQGRVELSEAREDLTPVYRPGVDVNPNPKYVAPSV
jgi:cytoskeletal protein CcmA (bactofilin family)